MSARLMEAIDKTLRYGEIFSFPLNEVELRQYLIGEKLGSQPIPPGSWEQHGKYFIRPGQERLVSIRKRRAVYTTKKVERAIKLAGLLRLFPGVRMIGLTGSVAAHNAGKFDDIDLLVVTAPGRLFLTRAIVFVILSLLGMKRPDAPIGHFDNKFCFNMWLEDSKEGLETKNCDLYTAYEVTLMKPLFGGDVYYRFLKANSWTNRFLPNFSGSFGSQYLQDSLLLQDIGHVLQAILEIPVLWLAGPVLEAFVRWFSLRRIGIKESRRHSPDVMVTDSKLMFHPASPRLKVLNLIEGS